MKRSLAPLSLATLAFAAACSDGGVTESAPSPTQAPVLTAAGDRAIPGQYIVVLKEGADPIALASATRVTPRTTYTKALRGFAGGLTDGQVAMLRQRPEVAYIEQDQKVSLTTTQTGATWGLDRIDQRARPTDGNYNYTPTGAGVRAYIVDTGILTSHAQFGGRASGGYSAINDGRGSTDCNGHGTHVAGTVGGSTYGVAKGVTLIAVRVLDCAGSGTNSGVIAGMDWVANNRVLPAVANMSLGGGASQATDDAVNRMHNAGVTVVVAAGNENQNACNVSPARAANAITVGSTTSTDARSSFSNFGTCVDVFAPGSSITSSWYTSTTATNTISGTSMASPHVAGVVALWLQSTPAGTPAAAASAIIGSSTLNVVTSAGTGSPNRLLYSLLTTGGGGGGSVSANFNGSLAGTGANSYTTEYTVTTSGAHTATLAGTGADFDLYLQKWNGTAWATATSSLGSTSSESINYSGTAGTYRWRVYSYSGSGTWTLATTRPAT
ncbi:MAG TPA: S8 family peptidase [Longimicrobium sp.]|nr:S8 family peptidase [Longimicrobium sp.]